MSYYTPLADILLTIQSHNLTIPAVITHLLQGSHHVLRDDLIVNMPLVLKAFYEHQPDVVFSWAFELVSQRLRAELLTLTQQQHGFNFNVKHATAVSLDGSFMQDLAHKMKDLSPQLWNLINNLLDACQDPRRNRGIDRENSEKEAFERLGKPKEAGRLAELGEEPEQLENPSKEEEQSVSDVEMGDGTQEDRDKGGDQASRKKQPGRTSTALRYHALLVIKSVVCISILLQSTNQKSNYVQSILGLFFHSAAVPEKALELLSHAGVSISLSSIHAAIKSLSKEASDNLRKSFRTLTMAVAYDNFDMAFKVAEPTSSRQSSFVSATSATAIPIFGLTDKYILKCSADLWKRDVNNPNAINTVTIDPTQIRRFHLTSGIVRLPGQKRSLLSERLAWHVRRILVDWGGSTFSRFSKDLGEPLTVNKIPVHKTQQVPFRAMNIKESTNDGNIQVMENLLRQGGLGEETDQHFKPDFDADISEWVVLVHGDLLTKERLDSVKISRKVEVTPKLRFQFVVFLPGLFHFEMACADAIWRTWIQPLEGRHDSNSMFHHVGILRPDETGKIGSKPGYQQMHHVIRHDVFASMLDCWAREAAERDSRWTSLEVFGKDDVSWDLIIAMSHSIVEKYVGTVDKINSLRKESDEARDALFENQILRNRDELYYLDMVHAVRMGDIGHVEASLMHWIYMFKACGKHKYAFHMLQFLFNLADFYPPELAKIIRMNWLCNPSGTKDGFRGVDWLQERNNLFTKVIYGGSGSNHTLARILEESVLIELYRHCHVMVENAFYLEHRTFKHAPADMARTLRKLADEIRQSQAHEFVQGRTVQHSVPDKMTKGLVEIQKQTNKVVPLNDRLADNDSSQTTVEVEDLAVE